MEMVRELSKEAGSKINIQDLLSSYISSIVPWYCEIAKTEVAKLHWIHIVEHNKLTLKSIWKSKGPRMAKTTEEVEECM